MTSRSLNCCFALALVLLGACDVSISLPPSRYTPPEQDPDVFPIEARPKDLNCSSPQTYRDFVNCEHATSGLVVNTTPPMMRPDGSLPPLETPPESGTLLDVCPLPPDEETEFGTVSAEAALGNCAKAGEGDPAAQMIALWGDLGSASAGNLLKSVGGVKSWAVASSEGAASFCISSDQTSPGSSIKLCAASFEDESGAWLSGEIPDDLAPAFSEWTEVGRGDEGAGGSLFLKLCLDGQSGCIYESRDFTGRILASEVIAQDDGSGAMVFGFEARNNSTSRVLAGCARIVAR